MKLVTLLFAFALVASACSDSPDESASGGAEPVPATTTTTTVVAETVAPPPTSTPTPESLPLTDPVVAADASIVDLDDDVTIATTTYALTADPGTEWELPFHVAVPEGWTYDSATFGFTNGTTSISFVTGCAGSCEAKAWDAVLNAEGGFLHDGMAALPEGASLSFGGRWGSESVSQTTSATFADGSGTVLSAHYVEGGARYLGCTATVPANTTEDMETFKELCGSLELDWTTVLANTVVPPITQAMTDDVAAFIDAPVPQFQPQSLPVEDDGDLSVKIRLPDSATFRSDSFSTEVDLGDDYSIFTDLSLDSNCDGICGPQEWEPKLNAIAGEIGRTRLAIEVENDTAIDSGWLLSGPEAAGDDFHIIVARWSDDADAYFTCKAELDRSDIEQSNVVIGICLSAAPSWLNG